MSQSEYTNPTVEYEEAQRIQRPAQSSSAEEAEAGQKLVPRPEDVTSFETEVQPDPSIGTGRSSGGKGQGAHGNQGRPGRMIDERGERKLESKISGGMADQR
ncbi:hypothetical protein GLOTRDRAFT_97063 [Gloeophyllum trabeum ATCC 11539]|uniref:Uncharacterized protein n=1 Tax=Gloeophyllum trabeum (strain ATCC 11539 / FP-39264 / Madison 617) TaxID=670483 RepID=S7PRG7_GLOTA|nr:uncharacterized protein GLOTRDRAFT_97063 [Gloeophyllum trabeum ATCC 11539]EPQ50451.1 hypothetical protein GLOTRDRAFT_97063 [Gloeophyllum trabeum ATCC 11539]